ncbi:MAG: hypothetical protein Q4C96_00225 [Planctomycetia bacterium]|nr:hypothetical protein [Planctomycetia bacterium]
MTNYNFRWRWGETNPIITPVDASTVIHRGDLLWFNTSSKKAEPASTSSFGASLSAAQTTFTPNFLGIAMQESPAGNDSPIRVATTGTFQFNKTGAEVTLGSLVGVDDNSDASALENQTLVPVSSKTQALGRVSHIMDVEPGTVYVTITSSVMCGGC